MGSHNQKEAAHPLVPELDEAHGLLEGVLRVAARVEDVGAQPDAPENLTVGVDLVQGVHHGLHALKENRNREISGGTEGEKKVPLDTRWRCHTDPRRRVRGEGNNSQLDRKLRRLGRD